VKVSPDVVRYTNVADLLFVKSGGPLTRVVSTISRKNAVGANPNTSKMLADIVHLLPDTEPQPVQPENRHPGFGVGSRCTVFVKQKKMLQSVARWGGAGQREQRAPPGPTRELQLNTH
jgi:hypothetical protein